MAKERGWICSCPDHSKSLNKFNTLGKGWANLGREWIDSNAGAIGDCKHIMSAKLSRGIEIETFDDAPIETKKVSGPTQRSGKSSFTFRTFKGFK